jgi:hypothetical protein
MWHQVASGLPSSLVLLVSLWWRASPPEPSVTTVTSIGPGGCVSDCTCPGCPEYTCAAQDLAAAGAVSSSEWWRTLALASIFVIFLLAGFVWISLPYICAGIWNAPQVKEVRSVEQAGSATLEEVVLTPAVVADTSPGGGKGGPVTPAVRAARRSREQSLAQSVRQTR